MEPDKIEMFCTNCEEEHGPLVTIERKNITVTLSFINDRYEFNTKCPRCGAPLFASRPAGQV